MALLTADWSVFGKDKSGQDEYFRLHIFLRMNYVLLGAFVI